MEDANCFFSVDNKDTTKHDAFFIDCPMPLFLQRIVLSIVVYIVFSFIAVVSGIPVAILFGILAVILISFTLISSLIKKGSKKEQNKDPNLSD